MRTIEAIRQRASQKYRAYNYLYRLSVDRTRLAIAKADPRIGCHDLTFVCSHNWGSLDGQAAMRKGEALSHALVMRRDREMDRLSHEEHIAEGSVGRYLWCDKCQEGR